MQGLRDILRYEMWVCPHQTRFGLPGFQGSSRVSRVWTAHELERPESSFACFASFGTWPRRSKKTCFAMKVVPDVTHAFSQWLLIACHSRSRQKRESFSCFTLTSLPSWIQLGEEVQLFLGFDCYLCFWNRFELDLEKTCAFLQILEANDEMKTTPLVQMCYEQNGCYTCTIEMFLELEKNLILPEASNFAHWTGLSLHMLLVLQIEPKYKG